jgi:uncharacterized protein
MKFVIVLVAVLALAWLLLGGRSRADRGDARKTPPREANSAARAPEGMVACAHCGVHLPESESLRLGTRVFCSAAHRDAAGREPGA